MAHSIGLSVRTTDIHAARDAATAQTSIGVAARNCALLKWSDSALKASATSWFVVAVLGQMMFVVYLFGFYGRAAIQGQLTAWNDVIPHGFIVGATVHNVVIAMHLAFAALIQIAGAGQVISGVRRRFPTFHRWNGRVYLLSACVMSVGGLVMVWTGSGVGDLSQHIAISIDALLILVCAALVLRHAMARRFATHRQWALRLFLVVSGVWFFRLALTFWIVANHGAVGFDPHSFTGPALTFIVFAEYVIPLAVLELYFRAQASHSPPLRFAMAASLGALTLLTAAGVVTAAMLLWLPHL